MTGRKKGKKTTHSKKAILKGISKIQDAETQEIEALASSHNPEKPTPATY